jgi:hypothetical protein
MTAMAGRGAAAESAEAAGIRAWLPSTAQGGGRARLWDAATDRQIGPALTATGAVGRLRAGRTLPAGVRNARRDMT